MDAISEVTAQLTSDQRLDVIGEAAVQVTISNPADDQRLSEIGKTTELATITNLASNQRLGDSQGGASSIRYMPIPQSTDAPRPCKAIVPAKRLHLFRAKQMLRRFTPLLGTVSGYSAGDSIKH